MLINKTEYNLADNFKFCLCTIQYNKFVKKKNLILYKAFS